jgi:PD-(D/E)XK endonuclease
MKLTARICSNCDNSFRTGTLNRKLCRACYRRNTQTRIRQGYKPQPTERDFARRGCLGAANELRVCTDLLTRGWSVFRSVSPNCPCDLIAMRGSKILRVEVRTGYRNPSTGFLSVNRAGNYDLFAIVDGLSIIYDPSVSEWDFENNP